MKTFDCVQMKRQIQRRFNEETQGMTLAERDAVVRRKAAEFRAKMGQGRGNFDAIFQAFDREEEEREGK